MQPYVEEDLPNNRLKDEATEANQILRTAQKKKPTNRTVRSDVVLFWTTGKAYRSSKWRRQFAGQFLQYKKMRACVYVQTQRQAISHVRTHFYNSFSPAWSDRKTRTPRKGRKFMVQLKV